MQKRKLKKRYGVHERAFAADYGIAKYNRFAYRRNAEKKAAKLRRDARRNGFDLTYAVEEVH